MSELRRFRNHINGEFRDAADGRTTEVINPATGMPYATAPLSAAADVDAAMAAAEAAFPAWRDLVPGEHRKYLLKIADAIEARAEELVAVESENTGKPLGLTRSEEIPPMVDQIRFFAGAARMLEGRSAGEYMEGMTSIIRREPVGVCAQVAPWNYPMMMAVWKFAPAIAAGNTVVLKPPDTTPASTVLLAEIIGEILPKGVFNVICGDRETGRMMVEHPTPAMAAITGSVRAGMQVAESAAKDVKRVHLELGGKAPVVVFEDVDIAKAVADISVAGFFNAGQDCTAATRVLVQQSIHDEFVAALVKAAAETKTGQPDDDVLYGPLNMLRSMQGGRLPVLPGLRSSRPANLQLKGSGQPRPSRNFTALGLAHQAASASVHTTSGRRSRCSPNPSSPEGCRMDLTADPSAARSAWAQPVNGPSLTWQVEAWLPWWPSAGTGLWQHASHRARGATSVSSC
ncbi:aldehyde dehydrogenase family protein [Streptomyces sp. NPDC059101]|uniref:aldehyde dehydrogenase family protein n=1 Tax=Streptomyces sp. NPDC059101 TaxID=3346728 RepID=UPI0036AE8788